ncbi:hypothetical protein IWZ00DRAFT_568650 [Phyllosticta capitalensis]
MVSSKSLLLLALLGIASAQPGCYEQPGGGERRPKVIKDNEGGTFKPQPKPQQGGPQGGGGGGGGGGNNNKQPPPPAQTPPAGGGGGGGGQGGGQGGGGGGGKGGLRGKGEGAGSNLGRIKSTMTVYGSKDQNGSGNCVKQQACGIYASQGYSAAVSQNLYGVGSGQGTGPACGTCWSVTVETDSSKNPLPGGPKTITVVVDNLCPPGGNPICAQPDLKSTNQYGANVNFDLCQDSGAQEAIFGGTGTGLGIGYAEKVDCSTWKGQLAGKAWN